MMVVVPAFPHADEAGDFHVVALNARSVYDPSLSAFAVCIMPDQPVSGYADRDTRAHAPDEPWHPANGQKQNRPWNLLSHPSLLQASIEAIASEARLKSE